MVVRHRAAFDRLPGESQRFFQVLFHESELAPCLERQRPSVKLIALPLVGLTGHTDHIVVRFLRVRLGSLRVATQRVDTRAERDKESGLAHALTGIAPLQVAPAFLKREDLVPPVETI